MLLTRCLATLLLVQRLVGAEADISFSRQIAPVLQAKCLGCHNAEKRKGGYRVDTFEGLLKAGKSRKKPIEANQPDASELFQRLITEDPDDRMPQKDDPLSRENVELFRARIAQGARLDKGESNTVISLLVPKARHSAPPPNYLRPLPIV